MCVFWNAMRDITRVTRQSDEAYIDKNNAFILMYVGVGTIVRGQARV